MFPGALGSPGRAPACQSLRLVSSDPPPTAEAPVLWGSPLLGAPPKGSPWKPRHQLAEAAAPGLAKARGGAERPDQDPRPWHSTSVAPQGPQVSWCLVIHRGGSVLASDEKCLEMEWAVPEEQAVSAPSGEMPKQMDEDITEAMHSGQMTLGQGGRVVKCC